MKTGFDLLLNSSFYPGNYLLRIQNITSSIYKLFYLANFLVPTTHKITPTVTPNIPILTCSWRR